MWLLLCRVCLQARCGDLLCHRWHLRPAVRTVLQRVCRAVPVCWWCLQLHQPHTRGAGGMAGCDHTGPGEQPHTHSIALLSLTNPHLVAHTPTLPSPTHLFIWAPPVGNYSRYGSFINELMSGHASLMQTVNEPDHSQARARSVAVAATVKGYSVAPMPFCQQRCNLANSQQEKHSTD